MSTTEAGVKFAAAAVPSLFFGISSDPVWLIGIPAALIAAWLARAAQLFSEKRPWRAIGRDIAVSIMLAGTVAIFAIALITKLKLSPVEGILMTWALAWGGLPAISLARTWLMKGYAWMTRNIYDDVIEEERKRQARGEFAQRAQIMAAENHRRDIDHMSEKLTEEIKQGKNRENKTD